MALVVTKEKVLVEDIDWGVGASGQDRGGNKVDSSVLPYTPDTISVEEAITARYTSTYVEANFAAINGNELNLFDVANGISGFQAVNYAQLILKADITTVNLKADITNVLELNNNGAFTPLFDYNPATKKFVDDSIFTAFQQGVTGSFTAQSGETITVQNGLIVGII